MSEKGPKNFPVSEQAGLPARREIEKLERKESAQTPFGSETLHASLEWVRKLQSPQFLEDNRERLKRKGRWELDGYEPPFEKEMLDVKTDHLNKGLKLLSTVIERMKQKIDQDVVSADDLSEKRQLAREYKGSHGARYNEGVMMETLVNWLDSFKKERIKPKDVDLNFLRELSESVYWMMYKIHQYGDVNQFVEDPNEFNEAALWLKDVQETIDACIKYKYDFEKSDEE